MYPPHPDLHPGECGGGRGLPVPQVHQPGEAAALALAPPFQHRTPTPPQVMRMMMMMKMVMMMMLMIAMMIPLQHPRLCGPDQSEKADAG